MPLSLQSALLEPVATPPASPSEGLIYFDSALGRLRVYRSGVWESLRPGAHVAISFGASGLNGTPYFETANTDYTRVCDYLFPGSNLVGAPTSIKAILDPNGATSVECRLYDVPNAQTIASVSTANAYPTVTDLGAISNVPTAPTSLSIEVKRTGGGGNNRVRIHAILILF